MTIDELFSKPISSMRDWMKGHCCADINGYQRYGYWFFNIDDIFYDLTIPKDSDWRIVPVMSGYDYRNHTFLDEVVGKSRFNMLYFGLAKKSKYGELLIYVLCGHLEVNTSDNYRGDYLFILDKIFCNDHDSVDECRVYLDGKDIVNNSELAVHYRSTDNGEDRWINEYEFLDKYTSINYPASPVLNALSKNKHSLNEYAFELENYAKSVQEIGASAYNSNKHIIDDNDFKIKCDVVGIKPEDVFSIWLSLYIENQDVTFDDAFGIISIIQSDEEVFQNYVSSCGGKMMKKTWDDKWEIYPYCYYHPYHLAPLFGKKCNVDVKGIIPLVKNLAKTREIYLSINGYKNDLKNASEEYKERFTEIAQDFENKINAIYDKIHKELNLVKDGYLNNVEDLYNRIHKKYPSVNDNDLGVYKNLPNIIENIGVAFEKTSVKLMKLVNPDCKETQEDVNSNKDECGFSDKFKEHAKILFDTCPELERIPYFAAGKEYDAPYDLYEDDYISEQIPEDAIYDYEEKYGKRSFRNWEDTFEFLKPQVDDWHEWTDLYPGQKCILYINRNLEPEDELED